MRRILAVARLLLLVRRWRALGIYRGALLAEHFEHCTCLLEQYLLLRTVLFQAQVRQSS